MSTPAEIAEKARQEAVPPEDLDKGKRLDDPELMADPEVKKTVTENQQVFFLLTKTIADEVKRDLEDRQQKSSTQRLAMFGIVFGIVTGIGSLLGYTFIDRSVDAAFNQRLDAQLAQVSLVSELALISVNADSIYDFGITSEEESAELIDRVSVFYDNFVDNVPEGSENIAFVSDQFANASRLLRAVEPLMSAFADGERDDLIIKLYKAAPSVLERSESILQDVVHSLGRTLLALPEGASAWQEDDGSARDMYETYRSFVGRAEDMGYPELFLLFELNFRHLAGAPESEMLAMIDKINDLEEFDRRWFIDDMVILLTQGWRDEPDAKTRLVSDRVRNFLNRWAEASETLQLISEMEG